MNITVLTYYLCGCYARPTVPDARASPVREIRSAYSSQRSDCTMPCDRRSAAAAAEWRQGTCCRHGNQHVATPTARPRSQWRRRSADAAAASSARIGVATEHGARIGRVTLGYVRA